MKQLSPYHHICARKEGKKGEKEEGEDFVLSATEKRKKEGGEPPQKRREKRGGRTLTINSHFHLSRKKEKVQ